MGSIEGVIFDMDGVLIDSEILWQKAEIALLAGEGLLLDIEDCKKTMGLPIIEAMKIWHAKIEKPSMSPEELTDEYIRRFKQMFRKEGQLKSGVIDHLEFWKSRQLPMAIASSSPMNLIDLAVTKFNLSHYFDVIYSGENEMLGKPHPGIYLTTARNLGVNPVQCVAIEDSINGMISAKAARIKLIAYLDEGNYNDTKYDFADLKLESFHNFGPAEFSYLESLM